MAPIVTVQDRAEPSELRKKGQSLVQTPSNNAIEKALVGTRSGVWLGPASMLHVCICIAIPAQGWVSLMANCGACLLSGVNCLHKLCSGASGVLWGGREARSNRFWFFNPTKRQPKKGSCFNQPAWRVRHTPARLAHPSQVIMASRMA